MSAWPKVKLGEVLRRVERFEPRDELTEYPFAGTYSFARGIFVGERKLGSTFALPKIQRVRQGDFVYCKIMAWEGAFGLVPAAADNCVMSGAFVAYELHRDRIDERFLGYFFKVPDHWRSIGSQSSGTNVRRQSLHPTQFEAAEIPLPPLAEQRRVVARIEDLAAQIHEARTLRQQAIEETEALPVAELGAVFACEAGKRRSIQLGALLAEAGYGSSEKCDRERMEGATPVLRIPNVSSERVNFSDLKYARLSQRDRSKLLVSEGDVLVVRTNGSLELVGRSAVIPSLDEPFAFASYMIRLRFDRDQITPHYAQRMLQHLRVSGALVDFARTTAGQYNVSLGRLRAADIPVPPLPDQRRIVAELDALQAEVDALKRHQAETAAELDALLPAILDRAFKGELTTSRLGSVSTNERPALLAAEDAAPFSA